MVVSAQKNRRRERSRGFRLPRSLFLEVPRRVAAPVLGLTAALTATADYLVAHEIWLGPVYLLLAAFSAWFVSFRYAVAVGVLVLAINALTGSHSIFPYAVHLFALDFALRVFCVLVVALMLGRARKSLEREWRLARTDTLTGALNRQAFFEAIKAETGTDGPALLAFADVDGLKGLNDEMGHELGDEGLRDFAGRVRKAIRKSDLFARIGGDEFVVFMKVSDEKAAKIVANRLNKVLNHDAEVHGATLKCSLGVLFLPMGSHSIDAELKLADKLMYSAKRVQAGVLLASARQIGEEKTLVSVLDAALPANRKSVVRQERRSPLEQDARELTSIAETPAENRQSELAG